MFLFGFLTQVMLATNTIVDYVIPKGSFVVPFLSVVHQDENFYEGATTFNPFRWMDPKNLVSLIYICISCFLYLSCTSLLET